ncbi:hypothetical protein [Actinomyces mediterranea]|uniref:hypothetical protein n=1 Tax=Actinomyces mediterranea TaxID=1871028 RepID=UPI00097114C9|nr:hypothetical protein [Actinomyces mediterranea]
MLSAPGNGRCYGMCFDVEAPGTINYLAGYDTSDGAPDFEADGPGDMHADDYEMELWVPIEEASSSRQEGVLLNGQVRTGLCSRKTKRTRFVQEVLGQFPTPS